MLHNFLVMQPFPLYRMPRGGMLAAVSLVGEKEEIAGVPRLTNVIVKCLGCCCQLFSSQNR